MKIVPNNRILILEIYECLWFSEKQPIKGVSVHIPVDGNGSVIPNRMRYYYDSNGKFIGGRKV